MAKVLLVDDAAFMRLRCAKLLRELGHDVLEAENGLDGVQKYQVNSPDVVFMDITMPEMDGLAALREIKRADPQARVAMLTAIGQQSMVMDALKSGAKDFIVKPFERERIVASLKKMLGQA